MLLTTSELAQILTAYERGWQDARSQHLYNNPYVDHKVLLALQGQLLAAPVEELRCQWQNQRNAYDLGYGKGLN